MTPTQWRKAFGNIHGSPPPSQQELQEAEMTTSIQPKQTKGRQLTSAEVNTPGVNISQSSTEPSLSHSGMIVSLMGGIGNQLFQYAFGISVAKARQEDVGFTSYRCQGDKFRPMGYQLDAFVNDIKLLPKTQEKEPYFTDSNQCFGFQKEVYTTTANTFCGYWQTEKYFDTALVRQKINFQYPLEEQSLRVAEEIEKAGKSSTFLHIRRGADYLRKDGHADDFHGVLSKSYYDEVIKQVRESYEGARFFVFGDNPYWISKNFYGEEFVIVNHIKPDTNNVHEDMHLMSLCQNGAIANSSFSWWAAWLGDYRCDRLIFAPKRWFENKGRESINTDDIVPNRWIRLGGMECDV